MGETEAQDTSSKTTQRMQALEKCEFSRLLFAHLPCVVSPLLN